MSRACGCSRTLALWVTPVLAAALAFPQAQAQVAQPATLRGRVVSDTTMRPIADAEVYLPTLEKSARTDAKGAFRILGIPPGTHRVRARRLSYAMYDVSVVFGDGETVDLPIVLPRVRELDPVSVVGEANLPLSFLDHRAVGFGYFMTRSDLEKLTASHLSRALAQAPGVGLILGLNGQAWILSRRATVPIRSIQRPGNHNSDEVWWPEPAEAMTGMKAGCYARVYLDRALLNPHTPAEPVDINRYPPEMLEAIEYFAGPSQTPSEYARLNSRCGVLVLHTRRGP